MKIAVTYENGNVFGHFGHTAQFKVYEIEKNVVVSSEVVDTNGSGHGALAGMLSELNVDVLICGGIGGGAQCSTDAVLIEDFDDYLYKSKGAADDFEASNNKFESWFQVKVRSFPNASVSISNEQAKTGEKSLKLVANNNCLYVNRSLPQMLSGEISFDYYVDSLGGDCYIGYKDAYNTSPCKSTIYSLKIKKDGKLYALDSSKDSTQTGTAVAELGIGKWNNIKIVFDIKSDTCGLYVNDVKVADLARNKDIPDYDGICFMSIATSSSSYSMNAFLDNFIAYEGVSMTAQAN